MSKVVITGIGVISPAGSGKESFWDFLLSDSAPASQAASPEAAAMNGEIMWVIRDLDERMFLERKKVKYLQRAEKLALISSQLALSDAGIGSSNLGEMRLGAAIGSVAGNLRAVAAFDREVLSGNADYADPSLVSSAIMGALSGVVSVRNQIRGFHTPVAAGAASGLQAILFAMIELDVGRVDAALAGGVDEICQEFYTTYFCERDSPDSVHVGKEPTPFSEQGGDIALSEAAALLILERLDHARRRKARIYAECAGSAFAYAPHGYYDRERSVDAAARAIERACREAGLKPKDIDLIYAGARENVIGGEAEARAIEVVFGRRLTPATVAFMKSGLAMSLGASGALRVAAAALSIERSVIPTPIIGCGRDIVKGDAAFATSGRIRNVLITSFSNEGHMSCLVLKKI